jgi:hypothetical protein
MAKCMLAKCMLAKCMLAKCMLAKCMLAKCMLPKCMPARSMPARCMLGTLLHLAATLAHGAAPSSNAWSRFLSNRLPSRVIRAGSCAELGCVT